MSTWDSMDAGDRAAMRDAGRNEGGGHERPARPPRAARTCAALEGMDDQACIDESRCTFWGYCLRDGSALGGEAGGA